MKKILIAVDFSESCSNAISYIINLINGTSIQVDMVHVYSIPVKLMTTITAHVADDVLSDKKKYVTELLEEHMDLIPEKNRGEIFPIYGMDSSSDIIDLAETSKADLIVMALRQKYSMIDRFIGTVTANTMSKTSVPVLAIPNGSKYKSSCNILFPTEQPYAKTLTDELADQLDRLFDYCNIYDKTDIHMVHINKGEGVDIVYKHKPMNDLTFIVSNASSVEEGIKRVLEKHEIDLIAIQKKSRKFWQRLYHSSITRKLLFQARLPILIITK